MRMQIGCLAEKCGAITLYPTYVGYFGYPHRCASPKISAWPSLIVILHPFLKGGGCKGGAVDTSLGHLQHYREFCVQELKKICKEAYGTNIERDTSVWKWREIVTKMLREKGVI